MPLDVICYNKLITQSKGFAAQKSSTKWFYKGSYTEFVLEHSYGSLTARIRVNDML